ncbi:DnaJ-like protein 4 [Sarcoptes scabiei]|nr:DnaJ-like protein 4 [Sarcoptes scabiei]
MEIYLAFIVIILIFLINLILDFLGLIWFYKLVKKRHSNQQKRRMMDDDDNDDDDRFTQEDNRDSNCVRISSFPMVPMNYRSVQHNFPSAPSISNESSNRPYSYIYS